MELLLIHWNIEMTLVRLLHHLLWLAGHRKCEFSWLIETDSFTLCNPELMVFPLLCWLLICLHLLIEPFKPNIPFEIFSASEVEPFTPELHHQIRPEDSTRLELMGVVWDWFHEMTRQDRSSLILDFFVEMWNIFKGRTSDGHVKMMHFMARNTHRPVDQVSSSDVFSVHGEDRLE